MKKILVLLGSVLLLASLAALSAAENNPKEAVASKAIGLLGREMRQKLTESMQKNGPAGSIDVCAKDAPLISSRIEQELGVVLKRTSLKVRNPRNAPDTVEAELLKKLAASHEAGKTLPLGVTAFPDNPDRYYKVISIEQTCLKCHGDSVTISEQVRKEIASTYPDDKAIGYKVGDFRGIISAIVK